MLLCPLWTSETSLCVFSGLVKHVRDRPFNLQGGLWFFVSFRIIIFFFPEYNIKLYDKNSETDFLFPTTKIRILFSVTLGIRIFF
jgi:hypothetical protein